jgi:hypothetical protein
MKSLFIFFPLFLSTNPWQENDKAKEGDARLLLITKTKMALTWISRKDSCKNVDQELMRKLHNPAEKFSSSIEQALKYYKILDKDGNFVDRKTIEEALKPQAKI